MSELPQAYTEKWRLARKPHKCCECNGTIFYKEKYHYVSGVWDSRGDSYKTCRDCYELRLDVERLCFGELRDYVLEGNYKPLLEKFIDNMDRRGKVVEPWMREQLRTCKNK